MTPLAEAELKSQNAEQYKSMIEKCPINRAGKPEEVAALAAVLMGPDGGFITGSDFLMDGGVTAAYWYGELNSLR
jgi:NAD(P)-dependent dehydrogenase (short-subunit alcohol dehydrogenase family)